MAQNITLLGASYSDVPAVTLPKTGGGTATFIDPTGLGTAAYKDFTSSIASGSTDLVESGAVYTGLSGKVDIVDYAPESKTSDMTQAVGKDASGKLWTTPTANQAGIVAATEAWLANNVDPSTGYVVDASLSIAGAAADAKATGEVKSALPFYKIVTHDNLFDTSAESSGTKVNCNTGITTGGYSWQHTTDYIPVTPGKSYYVGKVNNTIMNYDKENVSAYALFDSNKNFIQQPVASAAGAWNPIPSGVAYIRFSGYYSTFLSSVMVVEGTTAPTAYISYADGTHTNIGWNDSEVEDVIEDLVIEKAEETINLDGERIIDTSLPLWKIDCVRTYNLNLVDPSAIQYGKSIIGSGSTAGKIANNQYRNVTGFIAVKAGKRYYPSNICDYARYSSPNDSSYISGSFVSYALGDVLKGILVPEDSYICFSYGNTNTTFCLSEYCFSETHTFNASLTISDDKTTFASEADKIADSARWNLIDTDRRFFGDVNSTGISFIGTATDSATYQIFSIPGIEQAQYVLQYDYNPYNILEYDANWAFLRKSTASSIASPKCNLYTPSSDAINVIVCFYKTATQQNPFFAKYDALKNGYVEVARSTNDTDTEYFITGIPVVKKKRLQEILTNGNCDTILRELYGTSGLKWVCLGDSLTANGFSSNMYAMVAGHLGITPVNYGIVSSTIADYANDGTTGNPMCIRYTQMDSDADIVTVMGGTNDDYQHIGQFSDRTVTTLYGACHVLFKGLIERYPNAHVGVILPPQNGRGLPEWVDTQGGVRDMANMIAKVNAIKEVADFYSLPVLDLFYHGGIAGMVYDNIGVLIQNDYLHLTTAGYQRLAPKLLAFVEQLCRPY